MIQVKNPLKKIVVGYGPRRNRWMSVEGNYWQCCAEIPQEEPDMNYSIDDLIKKITKRCEATSWFPTDSCVVEYLKSIKPLKEENEELKARIKSLCVERGKMANAVSGAVWKCDETKDSIHYYCDKCHLKKYED